MHSFKKFILSEISYQENGPDISSTLKKLPKKHKSLLRNFKVNFQKGNNLTGDDGHVGSLDMSKKKLEIAAPWNYGREWTFLHELGHLVWDDLLDSDFKNQWKEVIRNTKKKKANQDAEELFCHGYANYFSKNKIELHNHPEWNEFMKKVSRI